MKLEAVDKVPGELKKLNHNASVGKNGNTVWYNQNDPVDEKRAWMAALGMTSERYDEMKESSRKRNEAFNQKYPYLKNLSWTNGEMYYTDDKGNRIDTQVALDQAAESMKDAMRNLLKDRMPNTEVETRVELLTKVIEGNEIFNSGDDYLCYVDPADFED